MKKTFQVGEGFFGEGVNAAHINTVLGHKSGPAGISFINSLAPGITFTSAYVSVEVFNVHIVPSKSIIICILYFFI